MNLSLSLSLSLKLYFLIKTKHCVFHFRFKAPDLLALKLDMTLLASSCVSTLVPTGLMIKYFLRVDKDGCFHTYPDRGGPFQSLQQAQEAIDSHHVVQRKNMYVKPLNYTRYLENPGISQVQKYLMNCCRAVNIVSRDRTQKVYIDAMI